MFRAWTLLILVAGFVVIPLIQIRRVPCLIIIELFTILLTIKKYYYGTNFENIYGETITQISPFLILFLILHTKNPHNYC